MKRISGNIISTFLTVLLLVHFMSCKKSEKGERTGAPAITVRPVGVPVTEATSETIGNNGGNVKSEDGRLEIEIPPDALAENMDISIQPLKNTAVSGIGYSYRLMPHGIVFKKKVTIRFHYANDADRLGSKEALEIAYQNDKGVWTCTGGTINEPLQKIVSVQTDHFSDWSLIAAMELTPVIKTVGLNESVSLKAVRYVHPVNEDDLLIPLTVPDATNGIPERLNPKHIVKWTLNGPGKLESNGAEAVYRAPSSKPANNIATVTVELNVGGRQVLLISTIRIIDEGISISIDGGEWKTYPGTAVTVPELNRYGLSSLRTSLDIPQIVFYWPAYAGRKSDGIYGWSMLGEDENHVVFEYSPDNKQFYTAEYDDGQDTRDSPGFISVEETEEAGKKYLTGMFAIDMSGLWDGNTGQQMKIGGIIGTFKVRRSW